MTTPRFQLRDGHWAEPGTHAEDSAEAIARTSDREPRAPRSQPSQQNAATGPAIVDRLVFGLAEQASRLTARLSDRELCLLLVLFCLLLAIIESYA